MQFSTQCLIPELARLPSSAVKDYFSWFISIIPTRLAALKNEVSLSPGFESWSADYSPKSIEELGRWFALSVETRPRSREEFAQIKANSPYPIEIPAYDLSPRSIEFAHDVGIYFAESLRHQHPKLAWIQILGKKHNIQFGHAALSGFGPIDFSPVHIAITLAYGIASKNQDGSRLKQLFDTWSRMVRS
jgi:hypothetical protein